MLANEFRRPLSTVRLALATFEQFGMIEIVDNVLCVSNWEKYQNIETLDKIREQTRVRVARYKEKQKALTNGNVTANATVTQGNATEEEREEDKDIKNIKKDYSDSFLKFWTAYPNKQAKATAQKAWAKIQNEPNILSIILSAIEAHKRSESWIKDGGKFIPHPATWLNGRRWEDEIAGVVSKPKKYQTVMVDGELVDVEVKE
jgi:hypothetical protein